MTTNDPRSHIRGLIAAMETQNAKLRQEKLDQFPGLPTMIIRPHANGEARSFQPVPWPEYALGAHSLPREENHISFYFDCTKGRLESIILYFRTQPIPLRECLSPYGPMQSMCQFGLEQAVFNNQPAVARYLFERGTVLHSNLFWRAIPPGKSVINKDRLLDESSDIADPTPLLQTFLDAGWHPNQPWLNYMAFPGAPNWAIDQPRCVRNRAALSLLLSHGADPGISYTTKIQPWQTPPEPPRRGLALEVAIGSWDPSIVDMLLAHGADPNLGRLLFKLVSGKWPEPPRDGYRPTPFAERREMAEWVLAMVGEEELNRVFVLPFRHLGVATLQTTEEDTILSYACAAQDWGFVEWLLEKGADPELLGGKALRTQAWNRANAHWTSNDPQIVRDLVGNVKRKKAAARVAGEARGKVKNAEGPRGF